MQLRANPFAAEVNNSELQGLWAMTGTRRLPARLASGLFQLSGFASSMLLLGVVSIAAVQALVAAGGPVAWGAVALGQATGLIAAVFVTYGWNRSGPAKVARASASVRRREYFDSVRVKSTLLGPVVLLAALVASVPVPEARQFAAMGAVVSAVTGLTGVWYFVGLARSYAFFFLETVPRALGTAVGIALMKCGFGVYAGLGCMGAGMLVGFAIVTTWVYWSTANEGAEPIPRRRLIEIMAVQRHGVISTVGSAAYVAAPLAIVSVVAPTSQPAFALADRMFRQFLSAISIFVSLIQGWVPRAPIGPARVKRARAAIGASVGLAGVLGLGVATFGGQLLHWMGDGQVGGSNALVILVAALLSLATVDSVLGNAVLATFDMLNLTVRATYVGAAIGLPLVALGAVYYGAAGALGGVIIGFAARIFVQLVGYSLQEKRLRAV